MKRCQGRRGKVKLLSEIASATASYKPARDLVHYGKKVTSGGLSFHGAVCRLSGVPARSAVSGDRMFHSCKMALGGKEGLLLPLPHYCLVSVPLGHGLPDSSGEQQQPLSWA